MPESTGDWSSALNGPGRVRRPGRTALPSGPCGVWRSHAGASSAPRPQTGHSGPLHPRRRDAWALAGVEAHVGGGFTHSASRRSVIAITIQSVGNCVQDLIFGGKFGIQCRLMRCHARLAVGPCRVPSGRSARVPGGVRCFLGTRLSCGVNHGLSHRQASHRVQGRVDLAQWVGC
jgi:hypothetical protein